jgi:hypothetical protein
MANSRSIRKNVPTNSPSLYIQQADIARKLGASCTTLVATNNKLSRGTSSWQPNLHAGETPRSQKPGANTYLKDICNLYLEHQHSRVQAGEIKLRQVYDQTALLKDFVQHQKSPRIVSQRHPACLNE